jgi:hypothetical protein
MELVIGDKGDNWMVLGRYLEDGDNGWNGMIFI